MPPPYKTEGVKAKNLESNDLVIAFMGPAGSGKSQIIDTLTRQPNKQARGGLRPASKDITAFRISNHEIFGSRIVLIETPGVDDKSDGMILEMISNWLPKTVSLSGIIYLHRITDTRMTGKPGLNLARFGELCGDQWAQSVILITTMWDIARNREACERREADLKTGGWEMMMENGAALDRFLNTPESAWSIVSRMVEARMTSVSQGDDRKRRAPSSSLWGRLLGRK
ncbi:hypothetical protein M413DRAFT_438911 [Hebeloma cylindrosporum]|uniref:G domain-containing protein n=1 Tax=Hebeloma cylindrosporum TaxID=76867 RepID=A0A0C2YJ27_HEBCY|nr:hypothetical protein M413DRAFT_438911 [Hebeloma cylindrosporum h7]